MPRYEFKPLLQRAEEVEKFVYEFFQELGIQSVMVGAPPTGRHTPDILAWTGKEWKGIEVKEDIYSLKSGNVCFERKALESVLKDGGHLLFQFIRATGTVMVFDIRMLLEELTVLQAKGEARYMEHVGNRGWNNAANPAWVVSCKNLDALDSHVVLPFDLSELRQRWVESYIKLP